MALFDWINNHILALPTTILFLGAAVYLTVRFRFKQFTKLGHFFRLISGHVAQKSRFDSQGNASTIGSFQALFTAMATAIGTGSVVGPSLAIIIGGPGALFWLVIYLFFGSIVKYVEILLALKTRHVSEDGKIIGGPMQYLAYMSPFLASWYGLFILTVFLGWQTVQSNTLATIFAQEGVSEWIVGAGLCSIVLTVLSGGAQRVGAVASKLVPIMFTLYVGFSLYILLYNPSELFAAIKLVFADVFSPTAFTVATVITAAHAGIFKGIFISEAGLGTAAIPHALADTTHFQDQAILGMYSTIADITLSILSGLLVLVTGVWNYGEFRSTLIYEAFKLHVPGFGQYMLLLSITLFVVTTVIGNGFNGLQIFSSFTNNRFRSLFVAVVIATIFLGSLMPVPLVWEMMNTFLAFAAFPHLIGLLLLVHRLGLR